MEKIQRRDFLSFLGKAAGGMAITAVLPRPIFASNQIVGLVPSTADQLQLMEGLNYQVLLFYGQEIGKDLYFGFNNDFTCFIPDNDSMYSGVLWVNHEYIDARFVSHRNFSDPPTCAQAIEEMKAVGGSIVHIEKHKEQWRLKKDTQHNKRIDGHTLIPFNWDEPIANGTQGMGTLANCSGGITPWGTILTCEENYDSMYGERNRQTGEIIPSYYGWEQYFANPPEHYGWVVEVNPETGEAQKHVALGRCSHECATMHELKDGRLVVYTGDDANDQCFYKFVSDQPGSLKEGTLYVANLAEGKWIPLEWEDPRLKAVFNSQTEVLCYLREAAALVGGTPLDRPEDIEIDPINGNVLVTLTNNKPKDNFYGSILKLTESEGYEGLSFKHESLITGSQEAGFACPDNMAFDAVGNLWFTSDISGGSIEKGPYKGLGNNGLFVVPRNGKNAGTVIRVANAPVDAELTGPWFSPDGDTLFLSVQHPGEKSESLDQLTSHWPDGGQSLPKPAVVAIQGHLLRELREEY